jgi:CRISPR/Cas system CSM-associated protein Csm4 (group 5 of RAMP superfamily)
MKQLFLILLFISTSIFAQEIDKQSCTYEGKKLYGRVKIVENFPDITIQIVDNLADIDVKVVEHFPEKCGEWELVENFPDLKVKIVENNANIKIRFVDHFPGLK